VNMIPNLDALKQATRQGTASSWESYANGPEEWGGPERLGEAIQAYQHALLLAPDSGPLHFCLGVAYRKRYDSDFRRPEDFERAAAALDLDPNQYIWRRRIQQYGPRLDKPYPFYDWVAMARKDITARGETPVPLSVEPAGGEIAYPEKTFSGTQLSVREPDPQGRILRDDGQFVRVETTVVPDTRAEAVSARVHVMCRPNPANKAHWNNEAGNMVFWVSSPPGCGCQPAPSDRSKSSTAG